MPSMLSNIMGTMQTSTKSYHELSKIDGYYEKLQYLRLYSNNPGNVDRSLMNDFYKSKEWLRCRKKVIVRDCGCDLGVIGLEIPEGETIFVHHINPITEEDVIEHSPLLFDMDNLITVRAETHNAIHYRQSSSEDLVERRPGDTKLW